MEEKDGWYGKTSLHFATENGFSDVVRFLLKLGAEVPAQTKDGQTPLDSAAKNGYLQVVETLLTKGADVNTQGGFCGTALQAASWSIPQQNINKFY